jgi:hypothetical protein
MKHILFTALTILSVATVSAQSFKEDPNFVKQAPNAKGYMLDTVATSALSKTQLYSNTMAFIANYFKDSRNVIENKDLELGEITFKGNTFTNIAVSDTSKKGKITTHYETVRLFFKCKVYLKDQKFKIILQNLEKPAFAILATGVNLPVDPYEKIGMLANEQRAASGLALLVIKDLALALNKKPENEF